MISARVGRERVSPSARLSYLLDLNNTLVGNSPKRGEPPLRPFIRQLEQEAYRGWLVDMLRPHQVILITARPNRYREATLERIKAQTNWQPMDAYFAEIEARPPQIKEHLLNTHIFPKYGNAGYFGLESNPLTRAMYARYTDRKLNSEGSVQSM